MIDESNVTRFSFFKLGMAVMNNGFHNVKDYKALS